MANKPATLKDIDGNIYKTIKIGEQVWMAENLKVTHYRNGDPIPYISDQYVWNREDDGAYCIYPNNNNNTDTYGLLYNWYAVNNNRNIAPVGWHIPTDQEWKQLEMYLGMSDSEAYDTGWRGTDEGGKLKETGTTHWKSPNTGGATNESGFSALPSGYRSISGTFYGISYNGGWWSSTEEVNYSTAWYRTLSYDHSDVGRNDYNLGNGFSVRCVKD